VQARLGRLAQNYNYGRAKVIYQSVNINGRSWKRKVHCDYMACIGADRRTSLRVGQIRDFVVVSYTHKDIDRLRGRVPQATLRGQFMFARLRQYNPTPMRDANMWLAPRKPSFRLAMNAIPIKDLCSYLHVAKERSGRVDFVNLIRVAVSFVNA